MKKVLRWIWQLPQNLVGFIMSRFAIKQDSYVCNDYELVTIYYTRNVFGAGVSLGDYILLDYDKYHAGNHIITTNHEHGHQKQSRILGPLYLVVVGISSALFNNLWDRIFHKNWTVEDRVNWYYKRFPEKWADKLGGVER